MSPKTVLIVDDSQVSRTMLKAIIGGAEPAWQVLEASSAQEAIEHARRTEVDLLTLDVNMPGASGLSVAPKLKKMCPFARIAVLTANMSDSVQQEAATLGLQCISKPITEDKVKAFLYG